MKKSLNGFKGITLIALVVTIVVLLILAGVTIGMLTGENGIIKQAQDAKDKTEQARLEELVRLAINALIAENNGDKSGITPELIAEEVNEMENRTDVTAQGSTFPTNILFPEEDRSVGVNIELGVVPGETEIVDEEIYSVPEAADNITPDELFNYEIIDEAETGATNLTQLPVKKARITGIKAEYCNGGGYNPETETNDFSDTNYDIMYNGTTISDTLVIPYQKEIDGEMYKITEVNLWAKSSEKFGGFPFVTFL